LSAILQVSEKMTVSLPPPDSPVWQEPWLCTYDTCPLDVFGQLIYRPSLAGNALFLALFAAGALAQLVLAIRYRTWGYLVAMAGGCVIEIVGYVGRIELWQDDFNNNNFIVYLVGCTIAPACFSAAIYLSLSRIILVYGKDACRTNPRLITMGFITCDVLSLCLQAAGGALASVANTHAQTQTGINIMIAGLSTQVASTFAFTLVCAWIAWFTRVNRPQLNQETYPLRHSFKFQYFLLAIGLSSVLILERCTFRVAELSRGFDGDIAQNQALFMVLDGAAMIVVVLLLTTAHPGLTMSSGIWAAGAFRRLKNVGGGEFVTVEEVKNDTA